MKVQTRLTLFCSIVFGIIYAVISFLIYGLYYTDTKRSAYQSLEKNAYITAFFYLEEDELNFREYQKVKEQFEELVPDTNYQVYNENNELAYGMNNIFVPDALLDNIRSKRKYSFEIQDFLCYGIFYEDNQGDFVVITKEDKRMVTNRINSLLWVLISAFFTGLLAVVIFSRWVSHIAYRPFRKIIRQVNNISIEDLDVQIDSPDTKDELQDLTETFNRLLRRVSETVVIQKNFVKYISHEFKTPLTSMLGNLEVSSLKERSPEEYRQLSQNLIQQIQQLEEILDTLIVVSDLRKSSEIVSHTRLDELVWEIIDKISLHYPKSRVLVHMQIEPEDEAFLSVNIDKTQLLMALYNLIENAVKYSNGSIVDIFFSKESENIHLVIVDKGIGIPNEQLADISKPFYRAENANNIQGSGIGLSIALRILEKNNITYNIYSQQYIGTKVELII